MLDALVGALGGGVGDLLGAGLSMFGASKARKQAKEDALNKFVDLRQAAERGGFNPLTALQATGGAGFGAYGSSAPPLASIELLTSFGNKLGEEFSGAADRRRATETLQHDLAKLQLDQARSGVLVPPPRSATAALGGLAPLRPPVATLGQSSERDPNASRSGLVVSRGNSGSGGVGGSGEPLTPPEMPLYNLYIEVYDPTTGRTSRIPNPDLLDAGPVEMATGLSVIGFADAAQNGVPAAKRVVGTYVPLNLNLAERYRSSRKREADALGDVFGPNWYREQFPN